MTTASALAQLTDRGRFERVALQVLRQFDGECAALLRSGTNALDEPIPSPVDGFCRVPGRHPPRFVLIECTTTEPADLRAKWLSGWSPGAEGDEHGSRSDKAGDLVKAAREAQGLRACFPDALFKVHLVVNQSVRLPLYADVQRAADELRVECEVWDLSRLADLLDRPEGQVFRRELGIPARDLSRGLLAEIGPASLKQTRREALTDPGLWVDRAAGVRLRSLLDTGGPRLIALVAGPGRGKTALGLQALDAHLRSGGLGLCVDADRVGDCHNMDEAVGRTLRSFAPDLAPGQEQTFRRLLEPRRPLLVLLDDVNRANRPVWLLQRLVAWARPLEASSTGPGGRDPGADRSATVVLVPVWPAYREQIEARLKESPWVATVEVDRMEPAEADEALGRVLEAAGCSPGPARRSEIVRRLERDPVLIGLLGRLLGTGARREPSELAADVVGHYHDRCVEEAVEQTGASLLKDDLALALDHLADHMHRRRDLSPSWSTVRGWFSGDLRVLDSVTALTRHGGIVRVDCAGSEGRLVFRHDRLMQEALSRSLAASIRRGDRPDALFDPFFAETTGQALRRVAVGRELLHEVADRCPLALFEAVRGSASADEPGMPAIIAEATAWSAARQATGLILPAVLDSIAWSLLSTDSPHATEFVRLLPHHRLLLLAGLRNGSAECGVTYLAGPRHFWAEVRDYQLERSVEVALARHRDRLVGDLTRILRAPEAPDARRKGAIELAGYLGTVVSDQAISECSRGAQDPGLIFIPTLWAALRCLGEDPGLLAIPMIDSWGGLPAERGEGGAWSQRGQVTHSLRMAFAWGVPDRTVQFLTRECGLRDDDFEWRLYAILEYMDHPDAIEYRVRYAARRRSRLRPGHFSFNVLDLTRPWDPETTPDPRRLSDVSRQRARDLWGGQDNDEHIRQLAFDLWLTRCVAEELPALREIDASSPLFRRAILARARLADATCVPALIPEIRKLSWHFRLAPPVWCLELHELADEYLRSFHSQIPSDFTGGRSDDHFALSELLMQIPRDEAEGLIVEHWDHLRYSSLFIQAALFVGTPRCLALADAAIRECPPEIGVLEHVDDHFGVMVVGRQDSVTLEHLERLLPYIDRLDAMSVRMVADFCNRRGRQEWVRRHILPYLAEGHRPDLCPTEADIEREFDRFARDDGRSIQLRFWADEVAGRLVTPGPLIGILQRWIASKGHPTAWRVAAEIIACVGSRSDLGMFEGWPLTGSDEERRVIENTRYRVERRSLG